VTYVSQSAAAAFNPAKQADGAGDRDLALHGDGKAEAEARAVGLFRKLGLPNPDVIGQRYPHQVSGGQLQRA
jgi:peptide/nickel transport system ATP-binding protein